MAGLMLVEQNDDRVFIVNLDKVDSMALYRETRRAYISYENTDEIGTFIGDDFDAFIKALNVKHGWNL